jgi:cyclic 2,3-diphosphoglycerate synthetase
VLVSDLVVLVGGGDVSAVRELKRVPVLAADLRLRPVTPLRGRRVAVFTTGPAVTEGLDAEVLSVSRNLGNRPLLAEDLDRTDADVFLVEIKAAAIDLVAEAAVKRGAEVVFAENEVLCPGFDEAVLGLVRARAHA